VCNREHTLHNWLTACQVRDTSIFDRALPPGLACASPPASRTQFRFCDPFPRRDLAREGAELCSSAREAEASAYLVRTLGEEALHEISPTEDPRVSLGEMPVSLGLGLEQLNPGNAKA